MKAAVLEGPGCLAVRELNEPVCPPGGALVEVEACAICPSDIKMARVGHRDLTYPRVLGHEVAGVVLEADPSLGVVPGARVQVWPGLACGACPACRQGADNMCQSQGILGFNQDGGFAQRMAVPAECAQRGGMNLIPPGLSSTVASLAEPLACCVHAQRSAEVGPEDVVIIFGAGPMGLLHTMLARSHGAVPLVVDPLKERRELALDMGAEVSVSPDDDSLLNDVRSLTPRGANVAILATPQASLDAVLDLMAPRGRVCLFSGLPRGGSSREVDLNALHYRELSLLGSYGCTSRSTTTALGLIAEGRVQAGRLITQEVSLTDLEKGFRHIEGREGLKSVVTEF